MSRRLPKEYRLSILERDNFLCRFCGQGGRNSNIVLEVHHIVWRSMGGTDDPENLMTLCKKCHTILHRGFVPEGTKTIFDSRDKRRSE